MPEPIDLKAKRTSKRPPPGEQPPQADAPKAAPKKRTPNDRKLTDSLTGAYQAIGVTLMGVGARRGDAGLANTGLATIESAESVADAWMELADKNPQVKKALQRLTEVTAVGVLVGLHVTIALPLLIDRGVIPEGFAAMAGMAADQHAAANGNGNGGSSGA